MALRIRISIKAFQSFHQEKSLCFSQSLAQSTASRKHELKSKQKTAKALLLSEVRLSVTVTANAVFHLGLYFIILVTTYNHLLVFAEDWLSDPRVFGCSSSSCKMAYFILLCGWVVFHCVRILHFLIHSSVNGQTDCFQDLAVVNGAAMCGCITVIWCL